VKVPANANPAQERQMLLATANRPIDSNTTFSTGGDVSRFQRRTVPARPSQSQFADAMGGMGKALGQAIGAATGASSGPKPVNNGVRVIRGNDAN
jgi:pilus assembly protein CpaB